MTKKERFAKGFAALKALPVTIGVPWDDVVACLRDAGALKLDLKQWENGVADAIVEEYNRTADYLVIPKRKAAPK